MTSGVGMSTRGALSNDPRGEAVGTPFRPAGPTIVGARNSSARKRTSGAY
jgi:hypothetical protein